MTGVHEHHLTALAQAGHLTEDQRRSLAHWPWTDEKRDLLAELVRDGQHRVHTLCLTLHRTSRGVVKDLAVLRATGLVQSMGGSQATDAWWSATDAGWALWQMQQAVGV